MYSNNETFTGIQDACYLGRKEDCVLELGCSGVPVLLPPTILSHSCFQQLLWLKRHAGDRKMTRTENILVLMELGV